MTTVAIRICSFLKEKHEVGTIEEIYASSHMLRAFFNRCKTENIPYAVLSRKYGIVLRNSKLGARYDGYSDNALQSDKELEKTLRNQYFDINFIYWNHRPLTHKKWVSMLKRAGHKVLEVRTLDELSQFFAKIKHQNTLDNFLEVLQ